MAKNTFIIIFCVKICLEIENKCIKMPKSYRILNFGILLPTANKSEFANKKSENYEGHLCVLQA